MSIFPGMKPFVRGLKREFYLFTIMMGDADGYCEVLIENDTPETEFFLKTFVEFHEEAESMRYDTEMAYYSIDRVETLILTDEEVDLLRKFDSIDITYVGHWMYERLEITEKGNHNSKELSKRFKKFLKEFAKTYYPDPEEYEDYMEYIDWVYGEDE